jgi:hypothetical protein
MATTEDGIEFYLVVAKQTSPDVTEEQLEGILRRAIRTGDAVFSHRGDVYAAIVAEVPGAGKATRRIANSLSRQKLPARTFLVAEPFPQDLREVASRVAVGNVRVKRREETPGDVSWKD